MKAVQILTGCSLAICLASCSFTFTIDNETITNAERTCEQNGGLDKIEIVNLKDVIVICNNGAKFTYDYSTGSFLKEIPTESLE